MRRMLLAIAQRVGTPVYELEANMPAGELLDWMQLFIEEQKAREPPTVADVGHEQFLREMGVQNIEG